MDIDVNKGVTEVENPGPHLAESIGTIVQGSVTGDVVDIDINKGTSKQDKPFSICPYCGQDLKLPKTPHFCPYCKEKLVEN